MKSKNVKFKQGVKVQPKYIQELENPDSFLNKKINPTFTSTDAYVNTSLKLGMGANNAYSESGYTNENLSMNWISLQAMYATNWITRRIIDLVANDMTRDGVTFTAGIDPADSELLQAQWSRQNISKSLFFLASVGRLYGGAIALIVIDGQDNSTPLNVASIRKDQFLGIKVYDRWQLIPSLDLVDPITGEAQYYDVVNDFDGAFFTKGRAKDVLDQYRGTQRIDKSRIIRMDGDSLPYFLWIQNERWSASILASIYDIITSYNTATASLTSAAYKASVRVLKVERIHEIMNNSSDGRAFENLHKFVSNLRFLESTENVTVMGNEDSLEILNYNIEGISDALDQMKQQLSGATGIPITKLFGESPKGQNSTGESDMRMYYDSILVQQENLRPGIFKLLQVMYASTFGRPAPDDFDFEFCPLWQTEQTDKTTMAKSVSDSITETYNAGIISRETALKELRQSSEYTGVYSNIEDDEIDNAAEEDPPEFNGEMMQQNIENNGDGENT